ncbi:hypothetical protein LSH36_934g00022 [Paralvinella palmiformis]|uniref:Uncharacterized protein n=1 Tax=Paralvinella palmiformis TaxID=53620 RepID=A0AAD9IXB4_9ANNE|nr:hypothetical protein LSH36_934g00022 [Paralvinella palmiformis]
MRRSYYFITNMNWLKVAGWTFVEDSYNIQGSPLSASLSCSRHISPTKRDIGIHSLMQQEDTRPTQQQRTEIYHIVGSNPADICLCEKFPR